jgi:formylglycine-generating enzyme required for sulfatase activity
VFDPVKKPYSQDPAAYADVDSMPQGATPNGLYHMIGNARQWVWNPWVPRPEITRASWQDQTGKRTSRGFALDEDPNGPTANHAMRRFEAPNDPYFSVGFRCAKSDLR